MIDNGPLPQSISRIWPQSFELNFKCLSALISPRATGVASVYSSLGKEQAPISTAGCLVALTLLSS